MSLSQSKSEPRETLSRFTFLNPGFVSSACHEEYYRDHRASSAAFEAKALVATARFAFENDTSGTPMDQRGIQGTLEIAEYLLGDLIDTVERLEAKLKEVKA